MSENKSKPKYIPPHIIETYNEDELMDSIISAAWTHVVNTGSGKGSGYKILV
jgi:hypothetical protein